MEAYLRVGDEYEAQVQKLRAHKRRALQLIREVGAGRRGRQGRLGRRVAPGLVGFEGSRGETEWPGRAGLGVVLLAMQLGVLWWVLWSVWGVAPFAAPGRGFELWLGPCPRSEHLPGEPLPRLKQGKPPRPVCQQLRL
jgi:hypothetical protein